VIPAVSGTDTVVLFMDDLTNTYGFEVFTSLSYRAFDSTTGILTTGTYTAGDVFSLYSNGSFMSYQINGAVVATSALILSNPYRAVIGGNVTTPYTFTNVRYYPTGQFKNPTETYISANSVAVQTITNTAAAIIHDQVPLSNLINPLTTPPFTAFVPVFAGVYKAIYSVQFLGISGNADLAIWGVINGTAIPDSATYTAVKNNDTGVITTELIVSLAAGDRFEWYAETIGPNVDIQVYAATASIPLAPGIITNIYKLR
jgi:hypothetical protein